MIEQPGAADLIATARQTLLDDILPTLAGDARFKALMIANALAIALRDTDIARAELAATAAPLGDLATLSAAIRQGTAPAGTHAALVAFTEARCRVSAPKALKG